MIPKGDPTAINPFQKMFSKGDLKKLGQQKQSDRLLK